MTIENSRSVSLLWKGSFHHLYGKLLQKHAVNFLEKTAVFQHPHGTQFVSST